MKKVTFLLLTVLLISTVFVGCDHGNKSSNLNNPTVQDLPEVNPEYSGSANPSQEDILRIVLLKRDGTELNTTEELELDLNTLIFAVVKNHKNETVEVDNNKFKFEVTNKKDSLFTFPNDESGPNPEWFPLSNGFLITGKKETSEIVIKVTHPKAFYTKKQIFNIKKIDHTWDSEYQGTGKFVLPENQNEGLFSEKVILKFKNNRYDLCEKTFVDITYKGKKIHVTIFDGSTRGTFEIKENKLILNNRILNNPSIFKIEKAEDNIKLIESKYDINGMSTSCPFIYEIKHTHGSTLF